MQRQQNDKMKQAPKGDDNKPQMGNQLDKQGKKQQQGNTPENYMTQEDIPESTNVSDGVPGSGKRQDTN